MMIAQTGAGSDAGGRGASEQLLRSVVDALDGGLCIVGATGLVLGTNRQWDAEFAAGIPTRDFFTWSERVGVGDLGPQCAALVRQLLDGGPGPLATHIEVTEGDQCRWFVCRVNPVRDHPEARAVVVVVDITDAMRTRADLEQANAEAALQALVARVSDDAVCMTGPDGVVQWVNEAFTRVTGYTAEEACGRLWSDVRHGSGLRSEEFRAFRERLARHGSADVELCMQTRTGREYWAFVQVRPVYTDGRLEHFISVERDVTERRLAEDRQRAATARAEQLAADLSAETDMLSAILGAVPQWIFNKDTSGRYTGCNRAFLNFLGLTSEAEVIGRTDADLRLPEGFASVLAQLERSVLTTGEAVVDRTVEFVKHDGRRGARLLSVLPLGRPGSPDSRLIAVAADVRQVREMERHLAQANRLESIGQLAAGIAHEINTPIQYVADNTRFVAGAVAQMLDVLTAAGASGDGSGDGSGGVEQLAGTLDLPFLRAEVPAALDQCLEGLSRVTQIVRAMKDYSHPGAGRSETDINRAVQSTVQVARNEYRYVACLELDLDPGTGSASCYEGELKQVVLNMVVNAAQAIEEGRSARGSEALGYIRVATRRGDGEVVIEVSDDGPGMDEATRLHAFDPFFTTKQVGAGTGQGLSLAHQIVVKHHQGRIDLVSEPGAGTTFTIHLPLTAPGGEAQA